MHAVHLSRLAAVCSFAAFLAAICVFAPARTANGQTDFPTVVLLHGLGRTARSMTGMADYLEQHGYRVVNLDYPSRSMSIPELAELLGQHLVECCAGEEEKIDFVTHSLGGIVVREYLAHHGRRYRGRVVMLGPPNHGSELVDVLAVAPLFEELLGPAAVELGTDPSSVPNALGPVHFDLGVIAGSRSYNPLWSWLIPGDDDGRVAVDRARVEGMADFLVVAASHTFMMDDANVREQTVAFLRGGQFRHTDR